jgi:hypothetical protein
MKHYTVSLTFDLEAESMDAAAEEFREAVNTGRWSVLVTDNETGQSDDR